MTLPSKITLILCSVLIFSFGCKDKAMERHLQKADGEWNIDLVSWTVVKQSSTSGQVVASGSTDNAGTFTFDNDGSGTYSYTIDTLERSGSFKWTVDDEKVAITSISQSINFGTGSVTQKAVAYTGTQPSKTKLVVEGSETDQYTGGSITQMVITATFTMTRK